jgi:DNA-directed RNA polymerase specialized sigma24 family protein
VRSRFEAGIEKTVPVAERLERLLAGDSGAAAWLFDTFAPPLLRRLGQRYGYLGPAEVEDLLQETFLLVLRQEGRLLAAFLERAGRPSKPASGSPSTEKLTEKDVERFLWDQACGLASNRRRSATFRNVVPMSDTLEVGVEESAEQQAIDRDSLARLDACLRAGGERVYLYYKLRYRDGLTPEQVADVAGWSRKATYKLRQALDEAVRRCVERLGLRGD